MLKIGDIRKGKEIDKPGRCRYIWWACPECGVEHWVEYLFFKNGKYKGRGMCASCGRFNHDGEKSQGWLKQGYRVVILGKRDFFYPMTRDRGRILVHRLVMAKHLNRCLLAWEIVHHKNGVRDDNRLENLELTASIGEHIREHSKGYKDGYLKGLTDGRTKQIEELKQQVILLEAENTALNAKMGESKKLSPSISL